MCPKIRQTNRLLEVWKVDNMFLKIWILKTEEFIANMTSGAVSLLFEFKEEFVFQTLT